MARKNQEITSPHPLVAIELGSHSVRAMAAEMNADGYLRVLGVESSNRYPNLVERGMVNNTSNASYVIGELLKLLANRVHYDALSKVFVPLGGCSMQIVAVMSKRNQVIPQEVQSFLLDEMEQECRQKIEVRNPQVSVLGLVLSYYKLDGQIFTSKPTQKGALIEAYYIAFVGRKDLLKKVEDSCIRIPKHIESTCVRPEALLTALASPKDLKEGCAILDMGAQTTTLSVFKGSQYLYTKVVAKGGYDISRAIEQLGVALPYAERLKCQYGWASPELVPADSCYRLPNATNTDSVVIRASELATLIAAQLDQTVDALMADLNQYAHHIPVLYITGGASMLNGMEAYLQTKTSIPVLYGSHAPWLSLDTPDEICAPNYASLVGTLLQGQQYRNENPDVKEEDDILMRLKKLKKKAEEKTLEIFTEFENN